MGVYVTDIQINQLGCSSILIDSIIGDMYAYQIHIMTLSQL